MTRFGMITPTALALLSAVAFLPIAGIARADELPPIGCEASDKIDGSSAADARKKLDAAGYHQATGLKKGCDNYWHGVASKDGVSTHVSLSPQGVVRPEGD